MQFALLAFLFGIALFVASRAAFSAPADEAPGWWLLVLTIAVVHAAAGVRVIGGAPVFAGKRFAEFAAPLVASLAATSICGLAAAFLASRIEVDVSPVAVAAIAGATLVAALVIIAGATQLRTRLRQFRFGGD